MSERPTSTARFGARGDTAEFALAGVRILTFGAFVAGNTPAQILAELGADVVKVEPRARPEVLRTPAFGYGGVVAEPSGVLNTVLNAGLSRSTRGLALDVQVPAGAAAFRRLAAASDVVIENFGVHTMAGWGLGFADLLAVNPRIVVLSLSGYGRTGPRAAYRAYGTNICEFVGLHTAWGFTHGTHNDYVCGEHGALAVVAALAEVGRTGAGVHLDVSQIETTAALMAPQLLGPLAGDRALEEAPWSEGSPLSAVVACLGIDRWLAVELEDLGDWEVACGVVGRPDLVAPTLAEARDHADELRQALAGWAAGHTPQAAAHLLQQVGLAASAVQDTEDVWRDPQLRSRHFMVEIDQPDLGRIEYGGPAHRMSRTPARLRRPGPRLGQHSFEVLREWIDLDDATLGDLVAQGALFEAPGSDGAGGSGTPATPAGGG